MARFKIIADGQARLYDILDDALTAGSAPGNAIRLQAPGVAEVHARVWRDGDGVWVSPVAGAPLTLDGKPVSQHRLRHGDRLALTPGLALEFLDPTKPRPETRVPAERPGNERSGAAAAAKPAPGPQRAHDLVVPSVGREVSQRRAAQVQRDARRRPPPKAAPRWHLFSGLLLLSAAAIWISVRVLEGSIGGKSAEDMLALAETQLVRGNPQLAQQTARTAAARAEGNVDLQRKIAAFEERLAQMTRAAADSALLENARKALENLKAFERIYLTPAPTSRPECREFVRIADDWQKQYAAVCERHAESAGLTAEVATLRARYAGAAQLDRPDDVEDVLFAARRATRLRRPRYRDAVRILDEFLAQGGDPAALERARAYRTELANAGREWLDQRLEQLQREFDRGRVDAVLSEVETLLSESVLDEWRPEIEARARAWRQGR